MFNQGKQNDVSLLTGATNDEHGIGENLNEWTFYLRLPNEPPKSPDEYAAWAKQAYGDQADRLLKAYPAHSDADFAKHVHDIGRHAIPHTPPPSPHSHSHHPNTKPSPHN